MLFCFLSFISRASTLFPIAFVLLASGVTSAGQSTWAHFEARHVHPAALTSDGSRLLVLDSEEARLSVFDIRGAAATHPVLTAEIQTGLEPVSVRPRTDDEVWVVNEASDSISIISLSRRTTLGTLTCPDEPADVVFAGGRAWVTCARSNAVRVFDAATREPVATLPLPGLYPRAMAAAADGSEVYVVCLFSGNGTTILPAADAPPPPAPASGLPPAPRTALIVPASDPRVTWTVADEDLIVIGTQGAPTIRRRISGVGTNLFDVVVQPGTGRLWVPNTEALNLVRFEPALRGHFADHRLTVVDPAGTVTAVHDLHAGADYGRLPDPDLQARALAQPHTAVFAADGAELWVAAFGSDRLARVRAADGAVLQRVDLRPAGAGARAMRGPRGLALHPSLPLLYVLNKLAGTVQVIDAAVGTVLHEQAAGTHDPLPAEIRQGRGFLFDARLSGNGTASCAVCHLDADIDGLAWDLGDPAGEMLTVMGANLSIHDTTPRPRVMHPMKGPMVTQTLRGMQNGAPFHWRGDRPTLQSFNPTFDQLLGGSRIPAADMDALAAYLLSLRHHPNPNRNPDRTLPASFNGGNPVRGRDLFNLHENHCAICHALPAGSDNNIDLPQEVGALQPLKNPPLRTTYQRAFFDPRPGIVSRTGFGMNHDGTGSVLPIVHPYVLHELGTASFADFADVAAFVLCFDTGTAPAACRQTTVTAATAGAAAAELSLLEGQARVANTCDLAVHGAVGGRLRAFRYDRTLQRYRTDEAAAAALTRAELLAMLGPGDVLTFMGTLPGQGVRPGGDRDADGVPDGSEPRPQPIVSREAAGLFLTWPAEPEGWFPETAAMVSGTWDVLRLPAAAVDAQRRVTLPPPSGPAFFRLRRTW